VTAINILRTPSAVHICTDGLTYPGGKPCLAAKVYAAVHMPLVLATRGLALARFLYPTMFHQAFASFDELVRGIEDEFPNMHSNFLRFVPDPNEMEARNTEVIIAGWSAARRQCECYYIRGGEEQGEGSFPPWTLFELDGVQCGPPLSKHVDVHPNHIERDMIAVMEAQRCEFPLVGGFCELTSLTQHAVTQRILRRWPDLPSERREADGPRTPPARAITYLRHHPETADKFDEEYGEKGLAARILRVG
jgi:hypothetical protein